MSQHISLIKSAIHFKKKVILNVGNGPGTDSPTLGTTLLPVHCVTDDKECAVFSWESFCTDSPAWNSSSSTCNCAILDKFPFFYEPESPTYRLL